LAEQGNAHAQYYLGRLYSDGRGTLYDYQKAVTWYRRAAEGGEWTAAFDLGMLYWGQSRTDAVDGRAPDDGLVRVYKWLGIAAELETVGCVALSAPMRDAVAQSMATEQVAIAKDLTRAWLAEHEKMDDQVASVKTGC
jgi:TPR repeat protein